MSSFKAQEFIDPETLFLRKFYFVLIFERVACIRVQNSMLMELFHALLDFNVE